MEIILNNLKSLKIVKVTQLYKETDLTLTELKLKESFSEGEKEAIQNYINSCYNSILDYIEGTPNDETFVYLNKRELSKLTETPEKLQDALSIVDSLESRVEGLKVKKDPSQTIFDDLNAKPERKPLLKAQSEALEPQESQATLEPDDSAQESNTELETQEPKIILEQEIQDYEIDTEELTLPDPEIEELQDTKISLNTTEHTAHNLQLNDTDVETSDFKARKAKFLRGKL